MASNPNAHRVGDDIDHKSLSRREQRLRRRTWTGFFAATVLRLTIWYTIITALFRCPTSLSDIDSASPKLCKPYLQAKEHATPYVSPYYNKYAAGYVEAAKPYVKTFETKVYGPVSRQVEYVYINYAAPRLVVAANLAEQQWKKNGLPYLDQAQRQAQFLYDRQLGPYVNQVSGAISPYVNTVQETATKQYHTNLVPLYEKSRPYIEQAYTQGEHVMVVYILPHSRKVGQVSYDFLATRLWPRLRVVYGENVEPQLARIRERLANYREGKKLESMAESDASTASATTSSEELLSSLSSAAESVIAAVTDVANSETTTEVPPTTETATLAPQEKAKLAEELKAFQDRFTKTSDKAADDLNERISEIAKEQIESQVQGVGQALLTELEASSQKQLDNLKVKINQIVSKLPKDARENEERQAREQAHASIRKAGKAIKEKAQHLRSWKSKYVENVGALIKSATDSTLKVVDSIRDLGLQDIGMRWASMEDVSYTDWSKYHAEKTVDQWKIKIQNVATGHQALSDTTREAEEVETTGMGIAQDAAKELSRLKDVASWKIDTRDSSDDFSTRVLPAEAKRLLDDLKDTLNMAGDYIAEAPPVAGAGSVASAASEMVKPDASQNVASSASSAIEAASSQVSDAASKIRKTAGSVVSNIKVPNASSASSRASKSVDSASSLASDAAASASSAADPEDIAAKIKEPVNPSVASEVSSSFQSAAKEARSSVSAEVNVRAGSDIMSSVRSALSEPGVKANRISASKLSSSLDSVASVASEIVDQPAASKASSKASKSAKEAVSSASSAAESVVDASSASSAASSVSSEASKSAKKASKSLSNSASSAVDNASSSASSVSSAASSASSRASEFAGNNAAAAAAQKPLNAASSASTAISSSASSVSSQASSAASSILDSADPAFHSAAALNLRSRAHSMSSSLLSSAKSAASQASLETPGVSASQISEEAVKKAAQYASRFVMAANEFAKRDPAEVTRMVMGDDPSNADSEQGSNENDGVAEKLGSKLDEVLAKATATAGAP